MKIQNFMVLFVIIVLPIIIVAAYYMSLQIDTINMQTSYNSKLIESTKEAIQSYEINTVEWNPDFSAVADSKRRDIMASINTFTSSFANSIGIGGASKETILPYIPAIAYMLYDGYYIYSPAETRITIKNENEITVTMNKKLVDDGIISLNSTYNEEDEGKILYELDSAKGSGDGTYNGTTQFTLDPSKAKTEYKHILKPFSAYSESYEGKINDNAVDLVVNYTLDNYIKIYGKVEKENEDATTYEYVSKEGYLTDTRKISGFITGKVSEIKFNGKEMKPEDLTENVACWSEYNATTQKKDNVPYVYTKDKQKVYFIDIDNNGAKEPVFINSNNKAEKIAGAYYKKLTIPRIVGSDSSYTEIYQDLTDGTWYRRKNNDLEIVDNNREAISEIDLQNYLGDPSATYSNTLEKDYSAINYCVESYVFSLWVNNLNIVKNDDGTTKNVTGIFESDPEEETSLFNQERREVIKETLISNLNQAITSYSSNTEGEYQLPVLSETDWDQILSNVSIVTFLQNVPIGMKYYNNYAIATSTKNRDYVDINEIYLQGDDDEYYHRPYCDHLVVTNNLIGYRNIDYVEKSFKNSLDKTEYYYLHGKTATAEASCYYCMVQRDLYGEISNKDTQEKAYWTAVARERYAAKIAKLPQEAESSYWIKAITNETGKGKIYIDVNKSGTPINGIGSVSKKIEKNIGYTYTVYGETNNINNTGDSISLEPNKVYDVQESSVTPKSSYTTNDKITIQVTGYDYKGVSISYSDITGKPRYGAGRSRFL